MRSTVILVLLALAVVVVIFKTSLIHTVEYGFAKNSLDKIQSCTPDQVKDVGAFWTWNKNKEVKITEKSKISLFLSVCKHDLSLDKREKGEHLGYDKIVVHLESGGTVNLTCWFSPKQNGDKLVSQTIRSRGIFKPFMMDLFTNK
ncbi:MAG: hypothetical protein WCV58_02500 [Patescibacteria group bacterium]